MEEGGSFFCCSEILLRGRGSLSGKPHLKTWEDGTSLNGLVFKICFQCRDLGLILSSRTKISHALRQLSLHSRSWRSSDAEAEEREAC